MSIACARESLLKCSFEHLRNASLEDYVETSIILQYNSMQVIKVHFIHVTTVFVFCQNFTGKNGAK